MTVSVCKRETYNTPWSGNTVVKNFQERARRARRPLQPPPHHLPRERFYNFGIQIVGNLFETIQVEILPSNVC